MKRSISIFPKLLVVILLIQANSVFAATRTASTSGNWSSTATWGGASVPNSGDDVIINPGITVTVDIAAECATLTMNASPNSSTITISGSNSLTIGGLLTMQRPGSGDLATINIGAGSLSCGSLLMEATTSNRNDIINISTGSLTVTGDVSTGTTGCEFNITGTGTINFSGSVTGTPVLSTVSGSTVSYSGSGAQEIIPGTYNGTLSIAGSGYRLLTASTTVVENLILSEGTLENNTFLTIADGATITRSQGSLAAAPVFSGTVDIVYSGGTSIVSSYEMPVGSGVLNNLTTNSGGLVQGGTPGATVNLLSDAFSNLNPWTGDIGNSNNQFSSQRTSLAGGTSREVRYIYGTSSSTYYTASMYRMINTSGYASLNINWTQFVDNFDAGTYPYTIKLQCATTSGGPWTDMYTLSPTGTGNVGPKVERITNWTTNVGGDFYIRFLIEGYTYGIDYWYFDNLVVDGQDPSSPSTVTVNGILDVSGGNYTIDNNTLNIAGTITGSSITGGSESNLIVSGGGANLTLPDISGGLNNLTITRTAGVSLANDLNLDGVLDLQVANPSASLGLLETGSDTLVMAETATTIGVGDVTGYVKRTSFLANKAYTFGNEYTSVTFAAGGTNPSKLVAKIDIGSSPSWLPSAIERVYDFVQTDGAACNATISTHYLDSELNGIDENDLVQWTNGTPGPPLGLFNWGKSSNNTSNNWVTIANVGIENFPTSFGQLENTLAADEPASYTWNGSVSTDWNTVTNWTPNGTPSAASNIVIPDATTTTFDPTLPASVSINTLRIQSGGILNASSLSNFSIGGGNSAWNNEGGTFNPSDGSVSFTNAAATIAGSSDFYDLNIADGATLTPGTDSHTRISNALTLSGSAVLLSELLNNTIEYNGSDQTVISPNGPTPGYHNLVLSGSGTKTMPGTLLAIFGSLEMAGTASATAGDTLEIGGSLIMAAGNALDLGAFTHFLGGDLTTNGGTLTSGSASLVFNGAIEQTITNSTGLTIDNLTISNTVASVLLGSSTDLTIAGDFTIESDATFDLGENELSSVSGTVSNSGLLKTQNTSATPVPSGISWSGEIEFNGSSAQTIVAGSYENVTLSGSAGVTAAADLEINGLLSLLSPNPSATKGLLDMDTYTVTFGPSSTALGEGEVTGIMRRTSFTPDVTYSYGHEFTSVMFPDVGTLPTEMSVKLTIGTSPTWKPEAIERVFDIAQTGGDATQAILYSHYLDSELNGNNEENIVDWVNCILLTAIIEYGRSSNDTSDNWLVITNVNMGVFAPVFGFNEISFSESELLELTWNGSTSTSWVTATNWTPNGAPSDSTAITIPDAATTTFDPVIPALATCKSITIESGGILNAGAGSNLTINGDNFVWNNNGTFNPGTGTITFSSVIAELSGSNDFHNINIEAGAGLYLDAGAYLGITGTITNLGYFGSTDAGATTVEYKGTDQPVASTDRLTNTYSTLLLSGSGTKTLASVPMVVQADLILSGTVNAFADTSFTVNGELNIGSGTSLTTGTQRHTLLGDLVNDGTLASAGSNLVFSGTLAQSLSGSSASSFDSLTVNNPLGLTLDSDGLTTVSGYLGINNGMKLTLPAGRQLTVTGDLVNSSDSTGLVLESDATGTASLIHNTAGVEATVQRYMTGNRWHIFSPGVTDQSTPGFLTDAANNVPTQGSNYGMMSYSESIGNWQYFTNPASGTLNHGSGYLLRHTTDDAVTSYGVLNSVTRDVAITRAANGWNCIGNPFPSAIGVREDAGTAEDFLTYNAASLDPSYASLYLWDEPAVRVGNTDYYKVISNAAFTPSRPILDMEYLQPGQGFLVKSVSGGATVSFTDAMRVHDNTQSFVKAARASWPGIILSVDSETKSASTSITFNRKMTEGLDVTYDAGLFGGDRTFRIYTRLVEDNGVNFMLQCLPESNFESMVVPVGFDCSEPTVVTFRAETFDLPSGCGAYLEDRKAGIISDLGINPEGYTVTLDSVAQDTGRFFLRFSNEVLGMNNGFKSEKLKVYYYQGEIFVKGKVERGTEAILLDLSGRMLQRFVLEESETNILRPEPLIPGIYLFHMQGKNQHQNRQIIIQ